MDPDLVVTTDHKTIGVMYIVTSMLFFFVGGLMALVMRGELAEPGLQFLSTEQFNQLFTMHGTVMLLLYATPIAFGFANYLVPLQIGAPDVAFPGSTPSATGCTCSAASPHPRASWSPAARPTSAGPRTPRCPTPRTVRASAATCG
ncbi:hypothetical protein MTP03_46010 [Tsukamurella sp. PLM1]|nr:hypothetical protein MTP03_46010 [Tsukamurella sp. PLM1]